MKSALRARLPALVGVAVLAAALSGCMANRMTYGTGTAPGKQTLNDITGLVTFGTAGKRKQSIQYQPRPKVVAPPSVAALPAPGSEVDVANANWPKDPDEAAMQRKRARAQAGTSLIPADNADVEISGLPKSSRGSLAPMLVKGEDQAMKDRENMDKAEKIRAELKSADAGVDGNGNRVRKTLTEPPIDYRVPDANAPVEFKVTKKKFRWPWQKADPNSAPEHLKEAGQ